MKINWFKEKILNTRSWQHPVLIIIIAIIVVSGIVYLLRTPEPAAAWFNNLWKYRQTVAVTNSGSAQTDWQLRITLDTATLISADKVNPDCTDIRITDASGALLPHWIENGSCNTSTTQIWTKVPSIPTSGANLYIYYGNSSALNIENGNEVFLFFDDFSSSTLNSGKWTNDSSATVSISDGIATFTEISDDNNKNIYATTYNSTDPIVFEAKVDATTTPGSEFLGLSMKADNSSNTNKYKIGYSSSTQLSFWYLGSETWTESTGSRETVTDDYHVIGIRYTGSAYQGYVDGSQVQSDMTNESFTNHVPAITPGIESGVSSWDWVIVRSYAATEPSAGSPSSEEKGTAPIAHWKFDEGQGTEVNNAMEANDGGAAPVANWSLAQEDQRYRSEKWDSDARVFTSGTYSWQVWGTSSIANVDNALEISYGDSQLGAYNYLNSGYDIDSNLTIGKRYRLTFDAKTTGGTASAYGDIEVNPNPHVTTTTFTTTMTTYVLEFVASSETSNYFSIRGLSAGNVITIDNISFKEVLATDIVNDNNGTIYGATYTTDRSGRSNAALDFDGSDDIINVSHNSIFDVDSITVEAWINPDDITTEHEVVQKRYDTAWEFGILNGNVHVNAKQGGTYYSHLMNAGGGVTQDVWNHIVWTYDAITGINKTYVNGVLTNTQTKSGALAKNSENIRIGARFDNSLYFDGTIADVKIYNYARTAAQVKADYNSTKGHIVGAAWADEDQCVSGRCLYFDGSDRVRLNSAFSFDLSDSASFSFWSKHPNNVNGGAFGLSSAGTSRYIQIHENGNIYFEPNDDSNTCYGTMNYDDQDWHHYVLTISNYTCTFYEDGQDITVDSTVGSDVIFDQMGDTGNGSKPYIGYLDEPKIYNYALTADQVKADYLAGQVGSPSPVTSAQVENTTFGAATTTSTGLVGHWKMDENSWSGTASEVIDSSGNGNHGTANNETNTSNGKYGMAGSFDGDGDYVQISSATPTGSKTISAWVNFDTLTSQTALFGSYLAQISSDGKLTHYNGSSYISSTGSVSTGNWYFITYVFDQSNNKISYYINGMYDSQQSGPNFNTTTTYIGIYAPGSGESFFPLDGKVDDVKIFNRALSADEIMKEYKTGPAPVAYYDFENNGGSMLYDRSGNNNHGTLVNMDPATDWAPGKVGSGLDFDGSDDYVHVPHNETIDLYKNMTVSAWVKTDSTNDYSGIVKKNVNNDGYQLVFATGDSIRSDIWNGTGYTTVESVGSGFNVEDGQWHYLTATYNNSDFKLYIDGQEYDNTTLSNYVTKSSADLIIGHDTCCGSRYFSGTLDEIKIYNYARTPEQILLDMYGDEDLHPIGYWKFDEGKDSTAYDSGVGGNDGTITGATWVQDGKINKALDFDGSNDYVSVGDIDFTDEITMSAWVNLDSYESGGTNTDRGAITIKASSYYMSIRSSTGKLDSFFYGVDATHRSSNSQIPLHKWTHVLISYDGSYIKWYINGELDKSYAATGSITNNDSPLNIGMESAGYGRALNGKIDEVKVYNYALSSSQVKQEYNQGKGTVLGGGGTDSSGAASFARSAEFFPPGQADSGLIGYWKMDESSWDGTSGEVRDYSGQGNHGTSNNGASITSGKYKNAGSFDGANDYVSLGTVGGYSTNFTITAWVNHDTGSGWDDIIHSGCGDILFGFNGSFLSFGGQCNSPITHISYGTVIDGGWHHVAASYDNSTSRLYVDGVLVNSDSRTGAFTPGHLNIGGTNAAENFIGEIDEVRIYNRTLSSGEIAQLAERGPIGYWNFEEGSGGTAYDLSGNQYNGSITNATYGPGKIGWGLDFDGTNDFVNVGNISSLNPELTEFTSTVWAKGSSNMSSTGMILSKGNSGSSGYGIWLSGGDSPSIDYSDGVTRTTVSSGSGYNDDIWHQYTSIHKDDGKAYLYIDGIYKGVSPNSVTASITSSSNFYIGQNLSSGQRFKGSIDEVKIYDYARTPAQIAWDYNKGKPVGHWDFDEIEGTNANDKSGNDNDGTLNNMDPDTDWLSGSSCKLGGCLDFDGENDYIQVMSDGSSTYNFQEYSIAAWFKSDTDPDTADQAIWSFDYTSHGNPYYAQQLRLGGGSGVSDAILFAWNDGSSPQYITVDSALTGTQTDWHHVVATFESGSQKLYLDGVEIGSSNRTDTITYYGQEVWIGRSNYGGYFDGKIDDVRIYNYALSQEQIKSIMNNGAVRFK